jgi:hypothetical protein
MIRHGVLSLAIVALMAWPALGAECPSLVKQVRDGLGNRFDNAKYQALALAAEAEKLHADGKHAESVAKAEEAAKVGAVKLTRKPQ